jgi:hypothetical protein
VPGGSSRCNRRTLVFASGAGRPDHCKEQLGNPIVENILIFVQLASDVLVTAAAVASLADTILRRRRGNSASGCAPHGPGLPPG